MGRRAFMVNNRAQHESTYQAGEALAEADSAYSSLINACGWMADALGDTRRLTCARGSLEIALHYLERAKGRIEGARLRARDADAPKSALATVRRAERFVAEAGEWIDHAVAEWNAERDRVSPSGWLRRVRPPRVVETERARLEELIERIDNVFEGHPARESLRDKVVRAVKDWDGSF